MFYMEKPKGFQLSEKENYVCRLKKDLYGSNKPQEHGILDWIDIYTNKGSGKEM
jgi:hypothetical protein